MTTDKTLPEPTLLRRVLPDHYWYGDVYGYTADQMRAALASQAELIAEQRRTIDALMVGMPNDGTTPVIRRIAAIEAERDALREQVEALRVALKPFAETDLTSELVRNTFGFDVLRARAAIDAAKGRTAERRFMCPETGTPCGTCEDECAAKGQP